MPSPATNQPVAADLGQTHPVVWNLTFVLTGVGSTFLGSFLPRLAILWHLRDRQAGMLVAALFLGSFAGTMLLTRNLRSSLHTGAWLSFLGFLLFAACISNPRGFDSGAFVLFLAGLGMGQLMTSINLIVGQSKTSSRCGALSNLSAFWCIGAILSPLFISISVIFSAIPIPIRICFLAAVFLLPASVKRIPPTRITPPGPATLKSAILDARVPRIAVRFALFFFLYGGVEASITGWLPSYSIRAGATGLLTGQWIVSLLWIGLAGGRLGNATFVARLGERRLLQVALLFSAIAFSSLLLFRSPGSFIASLIITGAFLGPIFPLALSIMIGHALSNRVAGAVLACCALGSAALPSALGFLSSFTHSLQTAMALPLACLALLFISSFRLKPTLLAADSP
jgi:MFS transporter, FHS family, glucose/mannose:H+ symporter